MVRKIFVLKIIKTTHLQTWRNLEIALKIDEHGKKLKRQKLLRKLINS